MSGISIGAARLALAVSFIVALNVSKADSLLSEFAGGHDIEKRQLTADAELVTHRFAEYQLVEIFIPANKSKVTVHDLKYKGLPVEAYKKIETTNTIAIVNGGFFGYNNSGKETPIGLTRENGIRKIALMPWDHGGVLTSDGSSEVRIFPAENASQGGRWPYAIQSKPIIILNGSVDVSKNLRDADFNRVAVGTTANGDILIVGLFHVFGQAATLVQFAELYKTVAEKRDLKILRALAMDGGSGAQIYLPKLKLHFGDTGVSYFPNAIRFDEKLKNAGKL